MVKYLIRACNHFKWHVLYYQSYLYVATGGKWSNVGDSALKANRQKAGSLLQGPKMLLTPAMRTPVYYFRLIQSRSKGAGSLMTVHVASLLSALTGVFGWIKSLDATDG